MLVTPLPVMLMIATNSDFRYMRYIVQKEGRKRRGGNGGRSKEGPPHTKKNKTIQCIQCWEGETGSRSVLLFTLQFINKKPLFDPAPFDAELITGERVFSRRRIFEWGNINLCSVCFENYVSKKLAQKYAQNRYIMIVYIVIKNIIQNLYLKTQISQTNTLI